MEPSYSLPENRLECQLGELKPAYSESQALAEAHRCLFCYDAPCITACPTSIDVPGFIRKISTGNNKGAAKTILDANILGHTCARVCPVEVLCVGACVFNNEDKPPIQIGRLQRFAMDLSLAEGDKHFEIAPATGCKIALIGAGPASLACAAELAILGHKTVIFEGRSLPGGLNTTGVAPYKMVADTALEEVAFIQKLGVEIRTNTLIGKDVTLSKLESNYDAIFLGVGLGADGWPKVPGEDLGGVFGAVKLIEDIKLDVATQFDSVKKAVVIGGGNTAIDIVRQLKKAGVDEVTMVYRRGEAAMSGYRHEWEYALKEGVQGLFHQAPLGFEGPDGSVSSVHLGRTEVIDGRVKLVSGKESRLSADLVAVAVGQGKQVEFLSQIDGLELDYGRVTVDAETGQTSNPLYYSGGDCVNGGKEVVNAAAEGKLAAKGIHQFLKNTGKF